MKGSRLDTLRERLRDERGGRVLFVSHCLLNENVRYQGGAGRRGAVDEIVDECRMRGLGICQMPCPEQRAWGGVGKRFTTPYGRRPLRSVIRRRGIDVPLLEHDLIAELSGQPAAPLGLRSSGS